MYSRVIDEICREMGLSVAFLGVEATPVFFETTPDFNFPSALEAREFDQARKQWLHQWHPSVVFVIDRWDADFSTAKDFDKELRSLLMEVSPTTGRVIFVSQVPAIRDDDQFNLRELVTWHMRHENRLPVFYPDLDEPTRKQTLAITEAETESFPNLRVLRADLPFYKKDGSVLYASGRAFYDVDETHLSEAGAEVVRGLFKSAIAEASHGSFRQPQ